MRLVNGMCILLFPVCVLLYPSVCREAEIGSEIEISDGVPVGIERLSERILLLNDVPPSGNVTAISTGRGIIVIDTGVSRSFGYGFRRIIEREFKRADFAYVINTHADRDHTFGNQAFADVMIIGHENCREALRELKMAWDDRKNEYVSLHRERTERSRRELEELIPGSERADIERRRIAANSLIASDLAEGQEIVLPTRTFYDRMTLQVGDIVLHLYYLGEGHTDGDILVHVPQEGLIVAGDAFNANMLICHMKQDRFDMARYAEILNAVLNEGAPVRRVICGHGSIVTGEEMCARRDYLNSLLEGIGRGRAQGSDLETVMRRLPLDGYSNLTRFIERAPAELETEHAALIEKYWATLQRAFDELNLRE